MEFIPAGEIIGDTHQVRSVSIKQSPKLPDGEYDFVDTYCNDSECDCRKTMIQVMLNGKLVSIINYGWESKAYYKNWIGGGEEDEFVSGMHGASIDISSPNLVDENAILELFNALKNDMWISKFKFYYNEVKTTISK